MSDADPGNPRETRAFVLAITLAWAVALVVLLVVDAPSWWPWCAAAGVAIGALGLLFLGGQEKASSKVTSRADDGSAST